MKIIKKRKSFEQLRMEFDDAIIKKMIEAMNTMKIGRTNPIVGEYSTNKIDSLIHQNRKINQDRINKIDVGLGILAQIENNAR